VQASRRARLTRQDLQHCKHVQHVQLYVRSSSELCLGFSNLGAASAVPVHLCTGPSATSMTWPSQRTCMSHLAHIAKHSCLCSQGGTNIMIQAGNSGMRSHGSGNCGRHKEPCAHLFLQDTLHLAGRFPRLQHPGSVQCKQTTTEGSRPLQQQAEASRFALWPAEHRQVKQQYTGWLVSAHQNSDELAHMRSF
jgi:hypothetical protein